MHYLGSEPDRTSPELEEVSLVTASATSSSSPNRNSSDFRKWMGKVEVRRLPGGLASNRMSPWNNAENFSVGSWLLVSKPSAATKSAKPNSMSLRNASA